MTIDDIAQEIARIRSIAKDDEAAHSATDSLYIDVLRDIANGNPNPMALAMFALQAEDIDFQRWCA